MVGAEAEGGPEGGGAVAAVDPDLGDVVHRRVRRPACVQADRQAAAADQESADGVLDVGGERRRRLVVAPGRRPARVVDVVVRGGRGDPVEGQRPGDRLQHVEQVPAEVHQHPAAGLRPAGEPALGPRHPPGPFPHQLDVTQPAEVAGQSHHLPDVGPVRAGAARQQRGAAHPFGLGQRVRLGGGEAGRLLHEGGQAPVEEAARDRGVQVVGGRDQREVGVLGPERVEVGEGRAAGRRVERRPPPRVRVDRGHHLVVVARRQAGQPDLPAGPPEPDQYGADPHPAATASATMAAVSASACSDASSVRWCSQTQS